MDILQNDHLSAARPDAIAHFLGAAREALRRLAADQEELTIGSVSIPREEAEAAVEQLTSQRSAASLQPVEPRELPFDKAALFLNVSQKQLQAMLDEKRLPCRRLEGFTMIPMEPLKERQREIIRQRQRVFGEIARMEQELGIYE
jgi:hypothetical protein